jgi:hypothetical protein
MDWHTTQSGRATIARFDCKCVRASSRSGSRVVTDLIGGVSLDIFDQED